MPLAALCNGRSKLKRQYPVLERLLSRQSSHPSLGKQKEDRHLENTLRVSYMIHHVIQ